MENGGRNRLFENFLDPRDQFGGKTEGSGGPWSFRIPACMLVIDMSRTGSKGPSSTE